MKAKWLFSVLALASALAHAQNQQMLNDSLEYAKTLTPSSSGQIVNPSAVSSSAWSSTAVPTTTPSGMGEFSNPTTSSNYGSSNVSGGLSTLGVQAQTDCSTYVNTGDAIADQRCAAINFMATKCITTTDSQNTILGSAGASQTATGNCDGTYGAGAAQFNYGNTVTSSDSIFTTVTNAISSAAAQATNCTEQTVTTQPAQYETNTCVKSSNVDNPTCNKTLDVSSITVTQGSCTNGAAMVIFGCDHDCGNDTHNAVWYCNSAANASTVTVADWAHGSQCGNYGQTGTLDLTKAGWQMLGAPFTNCEGDSASGLWIFTAKVLQTCDPANQTQCIVEFMLGRVYTWTVSCAVGDWVLWTNDGGVTTTWGCGTKTTYYYDGNGNLVWNYTLNGSTPTIQTINYQPLVADVTQTFTHPAAKVVSGSPTWVDNCTSYEN